MSAALAVLPDFLLIAAGALLARRFGYAPPFWDGVERIVYFVLFPALLFRSIATMPFSLGDSTPLVATAFAYTAVAMVLALAAKPLFGLAAETHAAAFQCAFRFNTYIVFSVVSRVAGADGVALASLVVGAMVPVVNVAAVAMLARGQGRRTIAEIARNPLVLATLAGIGWNAAGFGLPAVAGRLLESAAAAAVPMGLLAVGAALRPGPRALPLPALAYFHAIKLVAVPAIAWALARVLGLSPIEATVALVHASAPTATSAYILASRMNGRGAPVASIVTSGTLLAALTMPAWLALSRL